jgi:hypothetical protein
MRIAICLSGQLRNLSKQNQLIELIKKTNADVFISTWSNIGATSAYDRFFPSVSIAELIVGIDSNKKFNYDINKFKNSYPALHELFYKKQTIDNDLVKSIIPNIKSLKIEDAPVDFETTRTLSGVTYPAALLKTMPDRYMFSLPMFYKIADANALKKEHEHQHNFTYDTVIRTRLDLDFNNLEEIITIAKSKHLDNELYTTTNEKADDFFLNDTFAIGNSQSMDQYAEIFSMLPEYWNIDKFSDLALDKRAAESLLGYHIRKTKKIICKTIKSRALVSTHIARKSAREIYPAFLDDTASKAHMSTEETKAYALILNLYYREKGINAPYQAIENMDRVPVEKSWLLANIALRNNDTETALALYKIAHEYLYTHDARPTIDYASTLAKLGNHSEALKVMLCASTIHFKNHILLRNIGVAYLEISKLNISDKKTFYIELAWTYLNQACKLGKFKNEVALRAALEVCKLQNQTTEMEKINQHLKDISINKSELHK